MFSDHSLATDSVFAEVQLVSCRNVLIYFNRELQDRAIGLFRDALCRKGFLGIGAKESLRFSSHATRSSSSCARIGSSRRGTRRDGDRSVRRSRRRHRHRHVGRRRRGAVGAAAGAARRACARRSSSCFICRASGRACWSSIFSRRCAVAGARGAGQGAGGAGNGLLRAAGLSPARRRRAAARALGGRSRSITRGRPSTCCSNRPPTSTASGCSASS